MELRYYQTAAIDAVHEHMRTRGNNPAIVLPTGAGKTIVMAEMVRRYVTEYGIRIGVIAHVQELIEQNAAKLATHWPQAPLGIYSAGLRRRDTRTPVTFMGIQSVTKRARQFGKLDLLLVDEAHCIPLSGEGMYARFLNEAREANPELRVIGLTATPYRLGPGMVVGPDYTLNEIAYEVSVGELVDRGYLSTLVSKNTKAHADLSGVHVARGEFKQGELEAALTDGDLVTRTVAELVDRGRKRKSWLVFCATVSHCEKVSEELARHGIRAPIVTANTPKAERAQLIAAHQTGRLGVLININVLSTGYDAPQVDLVAMLRPTKSPGLYYQQVGRGLRLAPGKSNCLVLDFAGNIARHGPIDAIFVDEAKGEKAAALTRVCPECDSIIRISLSICPDCQFKWPEPGASLAAPTHDDKPAELAVLSEPARMLRVERVSYHEHHAARTGNASLRVEYHCGGLLSYREWINLEADGYPRRKAESWWRQRMGASHQVPITVADALELIGHRPIKEPAGIYVRVKGKYVEIESYQWADPEAVYADAQAATA